MQGSDFCRHHTPLNKLSDTTCAICLEDIKNPMAMDMCSHVFCKGCVTDSVLHANMNCPCCRSNVGTNIIEKCIKNKIGKKYSDRFRLRIDMASDPRWKRPMEQWSESQMNRYLKVFPVTMPDDEE